jgi:DNA repair protein RecO (recombination protein O)
MLKRTEGIVLKNSPYGEADLIVTYLTLDYGIIKVFAKSPRKIKSRFGSSLEPLTFSKISFWGKEDTNLPRLIQSDIIKPFYMIREDFKTFYKISELIELTLILLPEREINRRIFRLFLDILYKLTEGVNHDLLIIFFKIKLLSFTGFAPRLDMCARCDRNGTLFYLSQGSIMCERCSNGLDTPVKISKTVSSLYQDLLEWDINKIHRINVNKTIIKELSDILNLHIRFLISKPLKCSSIF